MCLERLSPPKLPHRDCVAKLQLALQLTRKSRPIYVLQYVKLATYVKLSVYNHDRGGAQSGVATSRLALR